MEGVGLIGAVVVGIAAGFIAKKVMSRGHGLLAISLSG